MPQKIKPDTADFLAIDATHGSLTGNEPASAVAERYRLVQAHKALRMGWARRNDETGHFEVTPAGQAALG